MLINLSVYQPQLEHGHVRVEIGKCLTPYWQYFSHTTAVRVKRLSCCGHLRNAERSGYESQFCPMNDWDGEKDIYLGGGAPALLMEDAV